MHTVEEYLQREFNESQAVGVAKLAFDSMTGSTRTLEDRVQKILASAHSNDSEEFAAKCFVIWDGDEAIAHARTFVRTIFVGERSIENLALATVCTAPNRRGEGLGRLVVQAAFATVDDGPCEFSIFQTGVPGFYQKLNCRLIDNDVVNRKNKEAPDESPFHSEFVMVYPADRPWPAGTVDLIGPGY